MNAAKLSIEPGNARIARTDTRAALLRVLADLMIEKNSLDVSFVEIAKRSGHGSSLIKYYFGSKEGMLRQLALQHGQSAVAELNHLIDLPISAPKKLRIHISGIINSLSRAPYLNILVQKLIHGADKDTANELADTFVRPVVDFQRRLLEQGLREKSMRPTDPESFFFITFGACDYIYSRKHVIEYGFGRSVFIEEDTRNRYIDEIYNIIYGGIAL